MKTLQKSLFSLHSLTFPLRFLLRLGHRCHSFGGRRGAVASPNNVENNFNFINPSLMIIFEKLFYVLTDLYKNPFSLPNKLRVLICFNMFWGRGFLVIVEGYHLMKT
jgi:hypothetical protein